MMRWINGKSICSIILILLFAVYSCRHTDGEFARVIKQLELLPSTTAKTVIDSLLAQAQNIPLVVDATTAHFLYRGNVSSVALAGDANGWDPTANKFRPIGDTDLWHFSANYPANARLEYKLVIDDTVWVLDPLNKQQVTGGVGINSELRMPHYVMPPDREYYARFPAGNIIDTTFYSKHLANSRLIEIYLPPGYDDSHRQYPLALFHDGHEYLELALADGILNELIATNRITPVIAVFVTPVDRTAEYAGESISTYGKFLIDELLPWVDARYRISTDPELRAVIGASNGGNISLWLGFNYPTVFGMVAAQSSNVEPSIAQEYASAPKRDITLYMDLGLYDIPILLPRVRNFIPILEEQGYLFSYAEYPEGHNWRFWHAHVPDILVQFFPAQ
ncbi:alpha/beta hydrolase-fold protein [Candidatus Neomarinimicrobiota bacterium]